MFISNTDKTVTSESEIEEDNISESDDPTEPEESPVKKVIFTYLPKNKVTKYDISICFLF